MRDPETPAAVVINEALELARTFSTEESVKFINGMLDAIRKKLDAVTLITTEDTRTRRYSDQVVLRVHPCPPW